ncbi:MAG: PDZ domain-containing protein [Acidobacteriota bacterium]|nr:PDZ domain-containing protein [Acidobacteriota bacterium]
MSLLAALMCLSVLSAEIPEARILRFPDIHGDRITFVHAGDIYIVDADGGPAHRLTSHEGRELFPKFSPDGRHIAFSAEYSGSRQVYVIDAAGGAPTQLTWYNDVGAMPPRGGFDYQVMDWTRDGKSVLFRGNRLPWGVRMGKYFTVPVEGGLETALPIPESGTGMFSPDGKKIVYNPMSREWRTWKRYRGGRAQDVWIYDLEANTSKKLTTHNMTDNMPVWVGDKIYFASDREYTLNLYSISPDGGTPKKVTDHKEWDVLFLSAGPKRIVYENGGYIRRYDPAKDEDVKVTVRILGDFTETMPKVRKIKDFIYDGDISPSGKRVVVEARGDIFSVPAKDGRIRNLTNSQGVRERNPSWSPDGKWVAYLSDRDGEYQVYVRAQDGSGDERRITNGMNVWLFSPTWSPDSKKLAFADKTPKLNVVNVESGEVIEISRNKYNYQVLFSWSTDSNWLAYTKGNENGLTSIWAYDAGAKQHHQLTSSYIHSYAPSFSPDGKYLYFLSGRDFNLTFSDWEFDYLYTNADRIYAAALRDDVPNPFAPTSDEEEIAEEKKEPEEPKDDKKKKKKKKKAKKDDAKEGSAGDRSKPTLQVAGFEDRVFVLPLPSGNYRALTATDAGVVFMQDSNLRYFQLKTKKAETVMERVGSYALAAKGKKLLYFSRGTYGTADLKKGAKGAPLPLDNLEMKVDPKAEWQQIYKDAARLIRDWFYDGGMHGYDWDVLVKKYQPMVDAMRSRADLDFILGELGGELNAGHYYVNSGDNVQVTRRDNGLLGARIVADDSGYYKVGKILDGENWHPNFRSPLRDVGVNVNEGDFILAVDGEDIKTDTNFYRTLEHKGNRLVSLLVNDKPTKEGARMEKVRTITRETNLFYLTWVNERKKMVAEKSGGRIGYMHLPNTAVDGNRELHKNFYAQMHKEALIFDDRYNGGGFIPFNMIQLIERPVLSYWARRNIAPMRTPTYAHTGPKATLINGLAASGGDAFPYYFRERGLGKLFGTRTWGGLIGLSGNPGFVDGGSVSVPMFRFYDLDGNWAIENEGVSPDVEVVDLPHLVAQGQDPTLEAAIDHLMKELERNPPKAPAIPTPPDESKLK